MPKSTKAGTVAVVIPFWNGSKHIERALKSIAEQTMQAIEVIVVNDGSNEEEAQAISELAEVHSFRLINKKNGGQGSARNLGVQSSTAEFVCFLDQDDYFLPQHIEKLFPLTNIANFGFAYGDLMEADESGQIVASRLLPHALFAEKVVKLKDLLRNDLFVLPSASIISTQAFLEVGGFDERLKGHEDDDLFLRLFRAGFGYQYLDDVVTVWCIHTGSTSWSPMMLESRWTYFETLAIRYPDIWERGIFYFRDCLVPRFEPKFLADLVVAKTEKRAQYALARRIYKNFISASANNQNMPLYKTNYLRFKFLAISALPGQLVRLATFLYQARSQLAARFSK